MKKRICVYCKKEYPLINEYFPRNKNKTDGFEWGCKECKRKYDRDRYLKKKEEILEKNKIYYEKNKDHILKQTKGYQEDNKDIISKRKKVYYQNNKEYIKNKSNRWYEEYGKALYEENKEEISKRNARWKRENKDKVNGYTIKRRTLKKKLPATLTEEQWVIIKENFNNSCAYCGMTEEEHLKKFNEVLHQDHFVPLSKGGTYTHNNIIPACNKCNPSKGNKSFFEWYQEQEFYSEEKEKKILEYLGYTSENVQQLSIL